MYDIAIIGLGPAGAFLARYLDKRFRVIAIDKKDSQGDGGFLKPCGGLLAPDAQKSLSRFHMTLPKEVLVDPQIFSVRTIDLRSGLVRHYQRHYINIDRAKFDRWLIAQIPPRVEIHSGAVCTGIERDGGEFLVSYSEGGQSRTVRSKYLVGADGAKSVVRHKLYPDFRIRTYLSVQQWFRDTHDTPFYSCIFDSSVTDSYAWGLSKDGCFLFGGAFPIKNGRQDFETLKAKLRDYGFQLDDPVKTEACLVLRPFGPRNHCYGGDGAFFAGEAAGFISPSSLEGISYAIDSGYMLARCLNESGDPNLAYRRMTRKIRLKLFAKYLKTPFLYIPFTRKLIMKSGLSAISVIEE